MDQLAEYRQMAVDLRLHGKDVDVDGTRELVLYGYKINPYNPWFALRDRKLNVPFIMKELQWYMRGDRRDASIGDYAGVWKSVIGFDGLAVSNYGFPAFRLNGLARVVEHLTEEPQSRRAIIYFGDNQNSNFSHDERKDQSCANSIHWLLRDGKLHTIVSQRSQDYIYGVSGDAVFMTLLTNLVARVLDVEMAPIEVQVASFHHYPKHTAMVERLTASSIASEYVIPWRYDLLGVGEAKAIIDNYAMANGPFTDWIASEADTLMTIEAKRAQKESQQ